MPKKMIRRNPPPNLAEAAKVLGISNKDAVWLEELVAKRKSAFIASATRKSRKLVK